MEAPAPALSPTAKIKEAYYNNKKKHARCKPRDVGVWRLFLGFCLSVHLAALLLDGPYGGENDFKLQDSIDLLVHSS